MQNQPLPVENSKAEIAVENHNFSTFSTGFSTGVFHKETRLWICISVYISIYDPFRQIAHFFAPAKYSQQEKYGGKKRA